MISFTVRMEFDPADRSKVEELVRTLAPLSRREPGCVTYLPHFVQDAPATLVIYEQYKDESALENHRNSDHFRQYAADGIFKLMRARQLERLIAID